MQVPQPEIESHLHSEMRVHLDLVCTKCRSTEEELRKTKEHLDLACTKLNNTDEELRNTKDHLDLACTKLRRTEEELRKTKENLEKTDEELQNTKEQFEETSKKHEERIHALENKPFIYTWTINDFRCEFLDKIESEPFYTSECGYKVRLDLYPNGFSIGKNTHLSIYMTIMKGNFDAILKWPFAKRVTLTLIDQHENLNDRKNITKAISGNQEQQAWNSRPLRESNNSRGFSTFVPHDELTKRAYILKDTIFLQAKFESVV